MSGIHSLSFKISIQVARAIAKKPQCRVGLVMAKHTGVARILSGVHFFLTKLTTFNLF